MRSIFKLDIFKTALILISFLVGFPARAEKNRLAFYAGPGSPTPLVDIVRAKNLDLDPDWISAVTWNREMWSDGRNFALELEGGVAQHLEDWKTRSYSGAWVVRVLRTPWKAGTFAFGQGLSYANRVPEIESRHLPKTSKLLYHLIMEVAFPWPDSDRFEWMMRVHHRSGIFGVFNGVSGGSDFLCLGFKVKFE